MAREEMISSIEINKKYNHVLIRMAVNMAVHSFLFRFKYMVGWIKGKITIETPYRIYNHIQDAEYVSYMKKSIIK